MVRRSACFAAGVSSLKADPVMKAKKRVERHRLNRGLEHNLCGLLLQVGAMYRDQSPGRDSSLEVSIGPRV
jgi:hypothetical protein